ncbi:MAG: hypothetical protein ABI401_03480 [Candidatus Dormibacter sp.]
MVRIFPLVIAARAALHRRLERFPLYRERALRVATALKAVAGVRIVPDPPHAHMMHVYLPGSLEMLRRRATRIAQQECIAPFRNLEAAEVPGYCQAG